MPVNVQQLGCDFFVFSGHKIFGPTGIGAVYAKEELLEIMPPWQGGGNMIRNVTFEETTYADAAGEVRGRHAQHRRRRRPGRRAGLRQPAGPAEHRQVRARTAPIRHRAALRHQGPAADRHAREKVGVLSFVLPDRPTEEVGRLLDQEGIAVRAGHHCASRRCAVSGWKPPSGRRSRSTTRPTRSTAWSMLSSGFCESEGKDRRGNKCRFSVRE